jgi:4-coumarate--CoA ligase
VEDVAVIGVPDEYSGELPKAFIVLIPGMKGSPQIARELEAFVEKNKVKYKWIRGGIEFVKVIPKTPSGKILRKDLRLREKRRREPRL